MTDHIQTRQRLRTISLITTFEALLDCCTLSDTDKEILRRHYIQEQDFQYIGDILGFSEIAIKKRHKKALRKIKAIL